LRVELDIPQAFLPLCKPARYKAAFGGRGSGKSHFFAEMLIARAMKEQVRWVCIREVQLTLKESVRQLLIDKIQKLGVGDAFEVLESEIRCPHGGLIIFKGMQAYNAESIKSLEGFDGAWVEEAQTLSDVSLRMLRPTIRKEGSEIWFSWNPRHDTDPVDAFFRGPSPPKNAAIVEVNWHRNMWLPSVLEEEITRDFAADAEMAAHVWGGGYQIVSEGSYYARLIAAAEKEGRVGHFPPNPNLPIITSWDLGVDDYTAIWFWQEREGKAYAVDYYEASGEGADRIIATALPETFIAPPYQEEWIGWRPDKALAALERPARFLYGRHYLPHDIRMREWGAGGRSRVETVQALGLRNVSKGSATNPEDRIAAARALLPLCYFNATSRVLLGLKRLRAYRRKRNDTLNTYMQPVHDDASHGADAFGEFAINSRVTPQPEPPRSTKPLEEMVLMSPTGVLYSNFTPEQAVQAAVRDAELKRAKRNL
jgi:phage terminase large subunit